MTRPRKKSDSYGSLMVSGIGYRFVAFRHEGGHPGYYIVDSVAKKKYGPYLNTRDARDKGKDFWLDGGARAGDRFAKSEK